MDEDKKTTLLEQFSLLPSPLKKRCLRLITIAFCITFFFIFAAIYSKDAKALLGVLFSSYLFVMAYRLIFRYHSGKICNEKMICLKATRKGKNRKYLALKKYDTPQFDEFSILKINASASEKELDLIEERTVLSVYYDVDSSSELIAWEIVNIV